MDNISISATIVTYNDGKKALSAVKSITENTKKYPLTLYVFDNGSSDETVSLINDNTTVRVFENGKNIGFGAAHNLVLKKEMGKYHFVINPDIFVSDDVLSDMVDFMEENKDVVMCMPKILNTDGTEQKLPKEKPTFKRLFLGRLSKSIRSEYIWQNKELSLPTEIDFCSGCFFCIRTDVFKKIGGFDKRFFMYLEDADLTQTAKSCGKVMILPQFSVVHEWDRASAKSIKYLFIHTVSCLKFLFKRRKPI